MEYIFGYFIEVKLLKLFSKLAAKGLIKKSVNNPIKKIAIAIGLNISSIEKPIFLIDINSLFVIKFLNKNAIERMTTKGIISEIIVGSFNNESSKKKPNVVFSFSNILEISSKFKKRTKIVIIIKFIKIYFEAKVKR
jgi:hypothetical protein